MKQAILFLMIALLGGCVNGPDDTSGIEKNYYHMRIDFQHGFDATQTVFKVDNESVFEGALTTDGILSLAETAETSVSEGAHTLYCSVDGAGHDTTIAVSDSVVIGVYRSFDDGTVHFTVYLPGHFPAYD